MTTQTLNTPPAESASAALKHATAAEHRRAEQSPFQRLLVSGRIPLDSYLDWLDQQWRIYRTLEKTLQPGHSATRDLLINEPWRRAQALEDDLGHFGEQGGARLPARSTLEFITRLEQSHRDDPAALLGVLYVLEGSTNGSKYIARNIRRAFGLDRPGTRFMDPHGEDQPTRWASFKVLLDQAISPATVPSVIAGAHATFAAVTAIGQELLERGGLAAESDANRSEIDGHGHGHPAS
jgi:heme oxygenase